MPSVGAGRRPLGAPLSYETIKFVHQAAVAISGTGFFVRGLASLRGAAWLRSGAARTLPHVVDSVLLASALMLAWQWRGTGAAWIAAKVCGLFVYVGLGIIALRPLRPARVRLAAWLGALFVFAWIASVAMTKKPLGFLAPSSW